MSPLWQVAGGECVCMFKRLRDLQQHSCRLNEAQRHVAVSLSEEKDRERWACSPDPFEVLLLGHNLITDLTHSRCVCVFVCVWSESAEML